MPALLDPSSWARRLRTAHHSSEDLGWVEITHPFHPLSGQRSTILTKRNVSGIQTLILRGTSQGSFSVPLDWTDQAPTTVSATNDGDAPRLDFACLLELSDLLGKVSPGQNKGLAK
jgi:hypothetical protein